MSDTVKIILSAAGVCALAVGIYFARLFMDGRRLRRERRKAEHRRRVLRHEEAQAEANRTGKPVILDDGTRPYPPGVGPGARV